MSDGADNAPSTLKKRLLEMGTEIPKGKKINFISVGVGSGFPTFIAMLLREIYHNGDEN